MTHTFEITENERLFLIMALGTAHGIPAVVADQNAPPATALGIARRLITSQIGAPAAVPQPQPAAPANTASAASTAKPRPIPADAKELSVIPSAITKIGDGDKERLMVEWKAGGQTKKASCWVSSRDIWPRLLERVKQPVVILVVEKSGYLNVVGVK